MTSEWTPLPSTNRAPRAVAGAVVAAAGLGVSHLVTRMLTTRESPVESVGTWIIHHTPGPMIEPLIRLVGTNDKPILITGTIVAIIAVIAALSALRAPIWPVVGMIVIAVVGAGAILSQAGAHGPRLIALVAGLATWLVLLPWVRRPLTPTGVEAIDGAGRRTFLIRVGLVAGLAGVATLVSRSVGHGRQAVEKARKALKLTGVTAPQVPVGADLNLAGQPRWATSNAEFYRIDTSLLPPAVDPATWRLRIHGMVDHPLEFSLTDLLERELTEDWVTLMCVSNPVGGDLIGNAWWSGVRIAPLLAEAGVHADADGVLQTSHDGWTCLTPLTTLTDERNAMLAVGMNGVPLPIEHGFPVRMIVPGLYGYVSATKWLVDLKVTRFDADQGYWTPLGWSAQGPIKTGSRIDVPRRGSTAHAVGGKVRIAGVAWHQHTGITGVQVSVDGGDWMDATLAAEPTVDSWVQWSVEVPASSGHHLARSRAIDASGTIQTAALAEPAPDGATGYDKLGFEVA